MAEGMLSLSNKIWANNGLLCDERFAFYWMAKAVETGELGDRHRQALEQRSLLTRDIQAQYDGLQKAAIRGVRGSLFSTDPNLGSLLLAARSSELRMCGSSTSNGKVLFGLRKSSLFALPIASILSFALGG